MYACVGVCICISTLLPSFYQKVIHSCSIGSTELCCRNCSSSGAASWVLSSNCGIKNWAKPMKIEAFNRKILANPLINQKNGLPMGIRKGHRIFAWGGDIRNDTDITFESCKHRIMLQSCDSGKIYAHHLVWKKGLWIRAIYAMPIPVHKARRFRTCGARVCQSLASRKGYSNNGKLQLCDCYHWSWNQIKPAKSCSNVRNDSLILA